MIYILSIFTLIALPDPGLVKVMARCHMVTDDYLIQSWPRFMVWLGHNTFGCLHLRNIRVVIAGRTVAIFLYLSILIRFLHYWHLWGKSICLESSWCFHWWYYEKAVEQHSSCRWFWTPMCSYNVSVKVMLRTLTGYMMNARLNADLLLLQLSIGVKLR